VYVLLKSMKLNLSQAHRHLVFYSWGSLFTVSILFPIALALTLVIYHGCSVLSVPMEDVLVVSMPEFKDIVLEEIKKARACAGGHEIKENYTKITFNFFAGDERNAYLSFNGSRGSYVPSYTCDDLVCTIWFDPRNLGGITNRRRLQWEIKNIMTGGGDGKHAFWMDWRYKK
jgi:hypothetical protein